jgi:hypothetical protein
MPPSGLGGQSPGFVLAVRVHSPVELAHSVSKSERGQPNLDGVADAELVLLMGFWTDGHFE